MNERYGRAEQQWSGRGHGGGPKQRRAFQREQEDDRDGGKTRKRGGGGPLVRFVLLVQGSVDFRRKMRS
jgi:hypothetical protein